MMRVLHTEGEWRLTTTNHNTPKVYIEHHCQADTSYKGTWVPMRFHYYQFSDPCGWCNAPVPKGLQALYVMLTDDDLVIHDTIYRLHP